MKHFTIIELDKDFSIPESLSECNQEQYIDSNRFIFAYQNGFLDENQFKSLMVTSFLGIDPSNIEDEMLSKAFQNIAFISQYIMNFFDERVNDEGGKEYILKLDYTHNPMKKVYINGVQWIGPDDGFRDLTFGKYVEALGLFLDYAKFQELDTLIKLFKVLYVPKFDKIIPIYFKNLKFVDIGILYGVYHLFAAVHSYICSSSVYYNGVEIDMSIIFEESEDTVKSEIPGLGLKSVLFDIAESGVFGDKKAVEETNVWEILFRLYDLKKKEKDMKAKQKSKKKK